MAHEIHPTGTTRSEGTKGVIPLNHIEGGNNHFPLEVRGGNPVSTGAQGERTNPTIPHPVDGSRAQTDKPVTSGQSERPQREVTTSPNRPEYEQSGQRELPILEAALPKSGSDPTRAGERHESTTELLMRPYRLLETPDQTPEPPTLQWSQQPQIHHQGKDEERRSDKNDASRQIADNASRPDGGASKREQERPERAVEPPASKGSEQETRETLAMLREIVGMTNGKKFMQILQSTEQGREAMDIQRRYDIYVDVGPVRGGSYYNHNAGVFPIAIIELPPAGITVPASLEKMAATYIHEMIHAKDCHTGEMPDIYTTSREMYVQGVLKREAYAEVKAIQHNIQRGRSDGRRLHSEYEKAYRKGSKAEQERNPHATSDERDRAGQTAGWQAVYEIHGEMKTSSTGERYIDYLRNDWDRVHGVTPQEGPPKELP